MRRIFLSICLFSVLLFPFAAYPAGNQPYIDGKDLFNAGNYSGAEEKFGQALAEDPRHIPSLFMMGEAASKDLGRLAEAEGWYKKAAWLGKNDKVFMPKICFSLGILYIRMGLYEDALGQFRLLTTLYPDFPDMAKAYNHMGVAWYHMDRYDEAAEAFREAVRLDPALTEAGFNQKTLQSQLSLYNVARYYERMCRDEDSLGECNEAIKADPDFMPAWYYMGIFSLRKNDFEQAVKFLVRSSELNSQYRGGKEILYQLAAAYAGRGKSGDADAAIKIYHEVVPYRDALLKAGIMELDGGILDTAEKDLREAADSSDEKATAAESWYRLGLLQRKKSDEQGSKESMRRARELMPDEPRYR